MRSKGGGPIDANSAVVGTMSVTLKMVGDYLTKFDSAADGKDGPKKATGELHVLPAEAQSFAWRIRCDVRAGVNMPLNDVVQQGLPSCFLDFGWSMADLSQNASAAVL